MIDRINKLQETKEKLKQEFVGIDNIIDSVIDSVTPWYLTPEIIERPVVVSLWGLTGTGKTSLIRKLVNYLGIAGKTLFYDCGEQSGSFDSSTFSSRLDNLFESSGVQENDPRYTKEELSEIGIEIDPSQGVARTDPLNFTFVFDEFQYLNTKDPLSGEEDAKPETRAIWGLMDSGLVDININNYKVKSLVDYLEDLEAFNETYPGLKIVSGRFSPEYSDLLRQQLSYYRWSEEEEDDLGSGEDNSKKTKKGYKVLFDEDFSFLIKRLNLIKKGLGFSVGDKLNVIDNLSDFLEYIKKYIEIISRPKIINCSKSLIFVLGNLDEAFELTGEDLDPDIDADVYHEITSKVNCMDIKTALRKRFRDEQVGRLGNNIIIYPSLRRCDFETIIERELSRILQKFEKYNGVKVSVSDRFKRLIYSEGCFPIQGVRPLFSTINSMVSPLLSDIIRSSKKEDTIIDVLGEDYNVPKITLFVETLGGKERIGEKEVNLILGSLRSPDRCKRLGLQSVHEASHAVLYHLLTDKLPSAIIASNIFGNGGYMMNEIESDFSVDTITDLENDVIVSLAGYYGEREFFPESSCSLGASSDINNVWTRLRGAYYECGLYRPLGYSERGVSNQNQGLPFGFPVEEDSRINEHLYKFFNELCQRTQDYIKSEKKLIAHISKYLVKNRSMRTEVFLDYVKKYGKNFGKQETENYLDIIEKIITENE